MTSSRSARVVGGWAAVALFVALAPTTASAASPTDKTVTIHDTEVSVERNGGVCGSGPGTMTTTATFVFHGVQINPTTVAITGTQTFDLVFDPDRALAGRWVGHGAGWFGGKGLGTLDSDFDFLVGGDAFTGNAVNQLTGARATFHEIDHITVTPTGITHFIDEQGFEHCH